MPRACTKTKPPIPRMIAATMAAHPNNFAGVGRRALERSMTSTAIRDGWRDAWSCCVGATVAPQKPQAKKALPSSTSSGAPHEGQVSDFIQMRIRRRSAVGASGRARPAQGTIRRTSPPL